ncbi:MAG: hypothetical protein PWP23_875 [Candidatus Sumerlaeota bacterium]|nr:hypothetical protein [Candidatus Sumerlaeota bacterium]
MGACLLLLLPLVAPADVIHHRNGQKFEGVIVVETPERVVIRLSGTELTLARELIVSIDRDAPEANDVLRVESALRTGNVVGALRALHDALEGGADPAPLNAMLEKNRSALLRPLERFGDSDRLEARHQLGRLRERGFPDNRTLLLFAQAYLAIGSPIEASDCLHVAGLDELRGDPANAVWARGFLRELIRQLAVQGRYQDAVEQIERLRLLDEGEAATQLPLLFLTSSARARQEEHFEEAARILAEDLAPLTPQIARNRAVVTLRVMTDWAEANAREMEARAILQRYFQSLAPLEAAAARQRLFATQAARHLRQGEPGLAVGIIEQIPAEERTDALVALGNKARFEARRNELNINDPRQLFDLGLWAAQNDLHTEALATFDLLRGNPVLKPMADEQILLVRKERDIRLLQRALNAYDSGLPQQALELCNELLQSPGHESQVAEDARNLAEVARREVASDVRRRPYQAEAFFQQAERAYFLGDIDEAWNLIDLLLREYGDTAAGERAGGLLPDVLREFEVQLLEGRRRKIPDYETAVSHNVIRASEELDKEIQLLLEAL